MATKTEITPASQQHFVAIGFSPQTRLKHPQLFPSEFIAVFFFEWRDRFSVVFLENLTTKKTV